MFIETKGRKSFMKKKKALPPIKNKTKVDSCGLYIYSPISDPPLFKAPEILKIEEKQYKDIETNTDFPFPDLPLNASKFKFKRKDLNQDFIVPNCVTPILPFKDQNPKARQHLTPLLPNPLKSSSIKSVTPIVQLMEFELGRSKSSSKEALRAYIRKLKTSSVPKTQSKNSDLREKNLRNIIVKSILKDINRS